LSAIFFKDRWKEGKRGGVRGLEDELLTFKDLVLGATTFESLKEPKNCLTFFLFLNLIFILFIEWNIILKRTKINAQLFNSNLKYSVA
jgi:hypothetical protein